MSLTVWVGGLGGGDQIFIRRNCLSIFTEEADISTSQLKLSTLLLKYFFFTKRLREAFLKKISSNKKILFLANLHFVVAVFLHLHLNS